MSSGKLRRAGGVSLPVALHSPSRVITHPARLSSPRRGKTLVEMLVVITATSVILGLAATTLVALFRLERQIRADAAQAETLARLGSRWRADAHAAVKADLETTCELTLPDGRTVHYAFVQPRISREVRRGQTVEHRDAFVLPERAQVSFSAANVEEAEIVRLVITQSAPAVQSYAVPVRPATIAAAVNLHRQPSGSEVTP